MTLAHRATACRFALAAFALAACTDEPTPTDTAWTWDLPRGFRAPSVPADNPMTADKVELGRQLFYDPRLSSNGSQACASCHAQARAFTDGRATPLGSTGEPGRHNAMSLANVAYNSAQTWASNVAQLEDQALVPMFGTSPVELGLTDELELINRLTAEPRYADGFARAFPDESITVDNVVRAIASFERTILSGNSRFDRFVAGDTAVLDAAEQRGLALFESSALGCTRCHGGFNLSVAVGDTVQYFNTGLYNVDGHGAYPANDRGLVETTRDPAHEGRFRPPTLRNIAVTAPYFHDGSAATLGDVVETYARGGRLIAEGPNAGDGAASPHRSALITGFALTADQRADLIAFLGALTDDELVANPAFADPW